MIAAVLGLVPALGAQEVVLPVCHKDCVTECAPACPAPCKKCVPTTKTKTVTKVEYGSGCEDFCLPNCSGMMFGGCGKKSCDSCNDCQTGCNDGTCHKCGKVKTRKYLIMKVKKHEECVPSCEVVEDYPQSCCVQAPCGGAAPAVMPTVPGTEKLPNKPGVVDPMKKK
jgi:hypothetical protein